MKNVEAGRTKRLDIQAWRGVAVLGVMSAHFGALVPAGFLGVDIFFAISGFVITLSFLSLLKRCTDVRSVLVEFWRRRFWRLVPALSVVLSATVLAALFLLPPRAFRDQIYMTIWSFFFAGNVGVEIVSRGDYFDPGAEQNWLLHLWSLGVEEQFYLVFPFLFLGLVGIGQRGLRINRLVGVVGILSVVSLALASVDELVHFLGLQNVYNELWALASILGYYSPVTRAWQFAVGVVAALLVVRNARASRPLMSAIGVTLLIASFVFMPQSNLLPGPLTLFPMAAMFLLLYWPLGDNPTLAQALRPLVWLGDRSYVAYLWHWPIWSALVVIFPETGVGVIGTAFFLTLVLSDATHRFVERPIIESSRRLVNVARAQTPTTSRPRFFKRALATTAISFPLVLGVSILTAHHQLEQSGVLSPPVEIPRVDESENCLLVSCFDKEIDILLIGDSHAGAISYALEKELNALGFNMFRAINSGCMHLLGETVISTRDICVEGSEKTRELIEKNPPKLVVSFGYTAGRFTTINSGSQQEIALMFSSSSENVPPELGPQAYRIALLETVKVILGSGSQLVLVTGTPDFTIWPDEISRGGRAASQFDVLLAPFIGVEFGETVSWSDYLARHGAFRDIEISTALEYPGVSFVDSWNWVCELDRCQQVTENQNFVFSDEDHLSIDGAKKLSKGIAKTITH